ncbi:dephospho-CoA kinase [Flavobacterium sp. PL11]|uniref:dephospho-CoA kinase n=1 Tax=Flavobacterium sp. PL11 TaxID=3071717 RepID=UPI002E038B3C|nr:dephospho-CoA kinase [Flavobacterium sp. PL11]MEC5166935.1 dephospho-CoA kinase [Flavobacterium sp. PL11]
MTKIIGLTGGIGSGKTTVAKYFESLGVPIYIADDEARQLMQTSEIMINIRTSFGDAIFDGEVLNREKLSQIVFNDPESLKKLNSIIHPAVKKHFQDWVLTKKDVEFIIYEAAILFESGNYKNCDYVISVTAAVETRIERVIARDNTTRENVLKRMKAQWTDEERIAKSDFVIENSNLDIAKQQATEILKIIGIKQ